jgi:FKBP-type peptidyl-prolyl cis-trans isomerase 2
MMSNRTVIILPDGNLSRPVILVDDNEPLAGKDLAYFIAL